MPRESRERRRARFASVCAALARAYPDARCELVYRNPLQLLVATILSGQSTDKQVNIVTYSLFAKCPVAQAYAQAPLGTLGADLRRIGLYRNKAKSLQRCCRMLVEEYGGEVPDSMAALVRLAGVGRKTANVVLGNAFDRSEGIVVDTHVARLSQRLGFSTQTQPEAIERDLMQLAPEQHWTILSHWLIWHGRRRCSARRPDCPRCELRPWCPGAQLNNEAQSGSRRVGKRK